MDLPKYPLTNNENFEIFEFTSQGKNGSIKKIVIFTEIQRVDSKVFNLCFGDKRSMDGEIDDLKISDNGDRDKVLATVAFTIYRFTDHYPDVWI